MTSQLQLLLTVLVVLFAVLILVWGIYFLIYKNTHVEPVERKWTDPKFHD